MEKEECSGLLNNKFPTFPLEFFDDSISMYK